mmetsp:Transcript_134977/g.200818  ORF Transcript_134977/g.200818 Transcript_134977/m.200818 type:complete len:372 (-) Transcript_134977:128-1243(-)
MLKLTMNPRKRSKRTRSVHHNRIRHNGSLGMTESEAKAMEQKDMLVDNMHALLQQESSGRYACVDYLSIGVWQRNVYDLLKNHYRPQHQGGDSRIDEYCREQIVEWSFRVVDYFRIDREVVALSLSFLDRFLATCECDRSSFKLAATTSLNLAVKLLHPCKLGDLGILSDLSRGEFDMHDVAEMESHILSSLAWSMHPPTAVAFTTIFLDYALLDRSLNMTSADIDDLHDISSFFTELAVCDYFFVTMRPSAVALACILNALEGMFGQDNNFAVHVLSTARRLNMFTKEDLTAACHKLWELYERSEECALHNSFDPMEEEKVNERGDFVSTKVVGKASTSSPVTVTKSCKTVSSNDFMCAMRSKSLRNGSW